MKTNRILLLIIAALSVFAPVNAADLPSPAILTANGDYDLARMVPGKEYLLTIEGTYNGATVTLTVWNDALQTWTPVTGGAFTARAEPRIIMPSSKLRMTVTSAGGSTSIGITVIPIQK